MWCIKKLDELSSQDFYRIARLRIDTFVVEQQRIYQELDDWDVLAKHVYYKRDGQILAYARMYLAGVHFTFSRFVTRSDFRGTGLGDQLIKLILHYAQSHYSDYPIKIESSRQVLKFYQQHGFKIQGAPYITDGIPFVDMLYQPE
ncbi:MULTISPECIES: GNAT family N-acetyltransferase [Snodgrassella]|uniref:GNAT family N-acetyltransferase n=1 Tax=Snodgrassella TaxID=1193515 RepID=UPI00226A5CA1|nr:MULTISPECIES: GNAT family N-acetyltransferase [unclassified Snodgrassella]MCT6880800.1 GNAT family N-acetyltransferase [Snodgrassella alvi]MCX8746897.1 GNAT family N-acetyltransferase [Snodgrassella sp. B3800]MCX8749877.1 GNAT family N-acetyltransferase [Snodgrassella sp. B3088]MCX8753454.1 GNAT family N-acetyltransferase [Snodgrassella sp. B3837]